MKLNPYPSYAPAGLDWIEELPTGWTSAPIKAFASCNDDVLPETTPDDVEIEYIDISSVHPVDGIIATESMRFGSAPSRARRLVKDGDVIVSTVRTYLRAIAKMVAPPEGLVVSTGFAVIRPRTIEPAFLGHVLRSEPVIGEIIARSTGVSYPAINPSELVSIKIPVPPEADRRAISAFLDLETAKIDKLIAEQIQFLELLNSKIVSLASQAIIDQSVEWVRLEHISRTISRSVLLQSGGEYTPLGLFNRGRGLFHKESRLMEDMGDSDFFWVEPGDLIFSGQFAWEGAVALAGMEEQGCVVSHRYPVIRGDGIHASTEYLYALFLTDFGDFLLNQNSRGAAGRNRPLNLASLLKEKVPVAPEHVQEKIREAIVTRKPLIEEASRLLALLQEHRSALITAVVTGKVDVREATA